LNVYLEKGIRTMHTKDLPILTASLKRGPAIIGRNNFTSAAVIAPLVDCGGEYHLLFEKRAAGIPQGSEICFPGGEFDASKDGSLRDTAIRECVEELGLDAGQIEVLGMLGTLVAFRGVAIDCYVGIFRIGPVDELPFDRAEVERVFTVPASWFRNNPPRRFPLRVEMHSEIIGDNGTVRTLFPARELGLPQRYWKSWRGGDHTTLVYRTEHGVIWGLTAQMVEELVGQIDAGN
jgi:8-oxo-dGTP pyrophosphatase MutT (NUDIX family)